MNSVYGLEVARRVLSNLNKKPVRWYAGSPFEKLDLRPGRNVSICAPPGLAKTTLALQVLGGVFACQPDLRSVFACVDLTPDDLMQKMLSRIAEVSYIAILDGELGQSDQERSHAAVAAGAGILERVTFLDRVHAR